MRLAKTSNIYTKRRYGHIPLVALSAMMLAAVLFGGTACSDDDSGSLSGGPSANVTGRVGNNYPLTVSDAVITIESLQAAFQPAAPPQRLSDEALVAPAAGVTFYQAIVTVKNNGQAPLRVDPDDFVCQVGNVLSTIEPTRSGPAARSLIHGTSLKLTLTFRGATGGDPTLIYNPPWYSGLIMFNANATGQSPESTEGTTGEDTTTVAPITE